jgi:hypothetical protein
VPHRSTRLADLLAGKSRPARPGARQLPLDGRVVDWRFFAHRTARCSRSTAATVFSLTRHLSSRGSAVIRGEPYLPSCALKQPLHSGFQPSAALHPRPQPAVLMLVEPGPGHSQRPARDRNRDVIGSPGSDQRGHRHHVLPARDDHLHLQGILDRYADTLAARIATLSRSKIRFACDLHVFGRSGGVRVFVDEAAQDGFSADP